MTLATPLIFSKIIFLSPKDSRGILFLDAIALSVNKPIIISPYSNPFFIN